MVSVQAQIPWHLHRIIKTQAAANGSTMTDIIIGAVAAHIDRLERRAKR